MCAPVEKQSGTVLVAVEDPHDLMRQDAIKAMNLAPRCEFAVGLRERHPRLHQPQLRPGRGRRGGSAGHEPHHHGAGLGVRGRGRGRARNRARARRDASRGVVQARQHDHHRGLQPRRLRHPRRALRQDRPHGGALPHRRRLRQVPRRARPRTETPSSSASRSCPSWTSPRSASPRTARSASRARWGPSSCAWPPSPPRAATKTW